MIALKPAPSPGRATPHRPRSVMPRRAIPAPGRASHPRSWHQSDREIWECLLLLRERERGKRRLSSVLMAESDGGKTANPSPGAQDGRRPTFEDPPCTTAVVVGEVEPMELELTTAIPCDLEDPLRMGPRWRWQQQQQQLSANAAPEIPSWGRRRLRSVPMERQSLLWRGTALPAPTCRSPSSPIASRRRTMTSAAQAEFARNNNLDVNQALEMVRFDIQYCDWSARQDLLTIMDLLTNKV
jgi:hypothetical protein